MVLVSPLLNFGTVPVASERSTERTETERERKGEKVGKHAAEWIEGGEKGSLSLSLSLGGWRAASPKLILSARCIAFYDITAVC